MMRVFGIDSKSMTNSSIGLVNYYMIKLIIIRNALGFGDLMSNSVIFE